MPTIPPVHRWHPPCGWRLPPAPAAVHPRPATLAAASLAATALAAVRAAVHATANLTALTTSGASGIGLNLGGVRVHHVCQPRDAARPVSVPAYAARG